MPTSVFGFNLAVNAHRHNKNLKVDSKTLRIDDPAANALFDQPLRGPWKLDI